MQIIAYITSIDPPSFVAWAVLAFAASIYPLGVLLGSSCSPCCGQAASCNLPALPNTIEVQITSGETQYASVAFSGGSPSTQFAAAAVWTIPGGTYVLQPLTPGSSSYTYSNPGIGIDTLDVRFHQDGNGTSIVFEANLSPMRQKTLVGTSTPPTQGQMISDNWFSPDQLDAVHSTVTASGSDYRFYKSTFGDGSAPSLTNRWLITESCSNVGFVTSRSSSAVGTSSTSGHSICSQLGCSPPFALQANQQSNRFPRMAPGFFGIPTDLSPFYPYISFSGNTRDDGGYGRVSGKATAVISSIMLVYAGGTQTLFAPNGGPVCSSFNNAGFSIYPTLPQSVVPTSC
jgi:hypothetical protein